MREPETSVGPPIPTPVDVEPIAHGVGLHTDETDTVDKNEDTKAYPTEAE